MRKTFSNVCRCGPRTSQLPNLQPSNDNEASAWYVSIYIIIHSSYWRGLTALSILCDLGNARACGSRMDRRNRHLRLFCIIRIILNYLFSLFWGVCKAAKMVREKFV